MNNQCLVKPTVVVVVAIIHGNKPIISDQKGTLNTSKYPAVEVRKLDKQSFSL